MSETTPKTTSITSAAEALNRYLLRPEAARPGHRVDVLIDASQAFPAMLAAIRSATREILFEMYTWIDDASGRPFVDALVERARQGVQIHALIDGFGSLGFSDAARARLCSAGVRLAVFHPVSPWRRRWAWSVRDHRKLLVVDRAVAFTGGLNLTHEYAAAELGGGNWHDVHASVCGPAVEELCTLFFSAWHHATGEHIATTAAAPMERQQESSATARVQVLGIGLFRGRRRIRKHYHFAIRQARSTVRIMVGYFIPDRGWRRVIRNAVSRGVDVRVMFPHTSDVPAVQWAARATYGRLLRAGVKVYEWLPSMLHAKAVSIDGVLCSIGTYNLDRRSFQHNWELSLLIGDSAAAAAIEQRFEADLGSCLAIDRAAWAQRGIVKRIIERFFYTLRRWL